ncbi:hypothetical protein JCM24511_06143 [Saitozyma sp. JCM 24511]|nr:hypothetical protein JCM24511_06143 [Saitozyma sp. JCM 24511]
MGERLSGMTQSHTLAIAAIKPGSLILVTGAWGYIAAHAVEAFLDAGSLSAAPSGARTRENAFYEPVKRVDTVAHMARGYISGLVVL